MFRKFLITQKRYKFTDRDITNLLKKKPNNVIVNRYSRYDPKVKLIIQALKDKRYNDVKKLAIKLDIDGHDRGENTPLTDAACRGDNDAVRFLIKEMGANIYSSCDCPYNKTALHYASENGHAETVKLLLELGANPNVLDSRKYTALDIAKINEIKKLLISNGGMVGNELPKVLIDIPRQGNCKLMQ